MAVYSVENKHPTLNKLIKDNSSQKLSLALTFAKKIHRGHNRDSGEPFHNHLIATAENIIFWLSPFILTTDIENLIAAALLHDSVEYNKTSLREIENKFGSNVRELVAGVSDLRSHRSKYADSKNLKFIAKKGHFDPRVFVIKLADRLHNMRTHSSLNKEKQIPKAIETLSVYSKLAESMGMWTVKKELEDICFSYIQPVTFARVKNEVKNDLRIAPVFDKKILKVLRNIFSETKIKVQITSHTNGLWATYKKRERAVSAGLESVDGFKNISDLKSYSVVTESNNKLLAYKLLGLIHTSPELGKFIDIRKIDDYIAKPQPNKYSAIQTTLKLPEGKVEIMITTKERFEFNNKGIICLIKEGKNLDEYKRNIIFDQSKTAWFLPLSSTYLDFVHMAGVGLHATSVKVDGKIQDLSKKTKNGVFVSIVSGTTNKYAITPELIKSSLPETRYLLEKQVYLQKRNILIKKGRKLMEGVLSSRGLLNLSDVAYVQNLILNTLLLEDTYDLYCKLSTGSILKERLIEILDKNKITKNNLRFSTLKISGKNKPGILGDVTNLIKKHGGNIYNISLSKPLANENDKYAIRILFKNIEVKKLGTIRSELAKDKRIRKFKLV